MARQKKTIPGDTRTTGSSTTAADPQAVKKRGRPVGSKNKTIRNDHNINNNSGNGDNSHMINYAMAFRKLSKPDVNDITQVNNRITDLFNISAQFDIKPSIAALAMAFQVDRATLFNWLTERTGTIKNRECFDAIKNAYNSINLLYEVYMNTGKINPVAGIFLMKNNLGYKDTTDYIITASNDNNMSLPDITNRANLLEE